MSDADPWSLLPRRWVHIQLPGYRGSPEHHTYGKFPFEQLPPTTIELDEGWSWLIERGKAYGDGLNQYERGIQPRLIEQLASEVRLDLPHSFQQFMTSQDIQSRVRSCTDCYLDPGERIVETVGSIPGHLLHFLSDSQSCAHWYLHIVPSGQAAVLESPDLYCYRIENSDWMENPACRLDRIDIKVRIPVNKFEEFRARIRTFGLRTENEKLEAQDVTKQYVDLAARLRNLHAQETQYLGILKQARTVKDTVEVSDKLNEVRLQIDQQQAEYDVLTKQVDTVAVTVSLHSEAEARVFGLHWRPLNQLKMAAREGIDGIGDYAASMAWFVFYIPAILLWLLTVLIGAALAWRILRWGWKTLFIRYQKAS